jgi:hypothetical protein
VQMSLEEDMRSTKSPSMARYYAELKAGIAEPPRHLLPLALGTLKVCDAVSPWRELAPPLSYRRYSPRPHRSKSASGANGAALQQFHGWGYLAGRMGMPASPSP